MPQQPQSLPQATPLKYIRDVKELYCNGVDWNDPIDSIKKSHYPILENMRSYTDGTIRPRLGITSIGTVITGQTPVHSIRRLNNKLNSTYTRIIGAGTKLATGQTTFTNVQYNAVDVAFSGNPLAMVPWRPDQSPVSWMYVTDSSAMYKVTYNGSAVTTHKVGIVAPITAPTVELDTPRLVGNGPPLPLNGILNAASAASWAASGIAGAIASGNRIGAALAITINVYDAGSSGWCSMIPASMANIGPGTILSYTNGVTTGFFMVWEVYRAGATTAGNTISTILYDNGVNAICTIVPVASIQEIKRNSVVHIGAGAGAYYRVLDVVKGPDNTVSSFRVNTGATAFAAGTAISVVSSFRAYVVDTVDATFTLTSGELNSTFTPAGTNLTGTLKYTPGASIDFTYGGSNLFPIQDLDWFHLGFKCADLSQVSQLRILFDLDDGSFTKNFYYRAITPSDLVAAAQGTQTVLDSESKVQQHYIIENRGFGPDVLMLPDISENTGNSSTFSDSRPDASGPDTSPTSPRDQTGTGNSQWSEIRFRRGDCVRVGTDWSKGWQAVTAIGLEVTMISGGAATLMEFSSLNVFGGAAPDIGDIGAPFLYRYRYRSSLTGARSNWSPPSFTGIIALRSPIVAAYSVPPVPDADLVDFQRFGGQVPFWADVGTVKTPNLFHDVVDDSFAASTLTDSEDNINFQPWVSSQPSTTGTASTVAGTMIQDSGTSFNTAWLQGTGIKINGLQTTIRRVLSTSLLEVADCVGAGTNKAWQIAEPFIRIDLPCFWGPINGWFFACGDPTNPGRLYFSNKNNPDSTGGPGTQGESWLDVTSPSEPLQNGFSYNGRNYVFSSEKLYEIVEISDGVFIPRETPTGKGLMYRWAFCVGPRVWFLAKDGIYETDGGIARSITFDTLFPVFPKEGQLGFAVNGFNPPNMVTGNITVSGKTADASSFFTMAYYGDYLYFLYPDTTNHMRVLTYQIGNFSFVYQGTPQAGWFPDVYNPAGGNTGIMVIYGEGGDGIHNLLMGGAEATTATLYSYGGTTDAGTAVPWHFRQGSADEGDKRSDKLWADFVVSADAGGGTINVAAGINEYSSTVALNNPATGAATITGSGRTKATFDINTGNGVEARNFAVDLSGTGTTAVLYFIETAFAPRPEDSFKRATQYDDAGYEGEKWFQGIEIEADTQNTVRPVSIQYDGGTVADSITVQHNGRRMVPYSFSSGFVAHLVRLAPSDSNLWKLYRWKWIWEPEPPLVTVWDTQQTSHGHAGFIHLKAIWITHTSTSDLTLTITRMDDNTSRSFTITNSGGVRGKETYLPIGPASFCKGKTYKYKITQASNTPFRIYQRHCGVLVKPWGSAQAYARWVGWGGDSGDGVAQI